MVGDIWCDPPSGWKYGFPKKVPANEVFSTEWLIKNGYPEKEIASYGEHFNVRFWKENDNESE